ncbi:zf-HC2 domain-containing protein [Streptomyces sp. CAU 1734]|uniref:zf-HC2 domain-containing protein n=1 Tax=Streptomyces sp. CAU 1734 TaxID=3140360 RepID=UPI0032604424
MTDCPPPPHPAGELLGRYALGGAAPGEREGVETHLDGCALCRARLAARTDPLPVERVWRRLDRAADLPVPGPWERLLLRIGVPDHAARLLAATPALRAGWLCGTVMTLLLSVLLVRLSGPGAAPTVYLSVAPLLPAAGVAVSLGLHWDPGYELGRIAAPSAFRLVLLRTAMVLATTVPPAAAAAFALPGPGPGLAAFGWLLPSLLLTVVSLVLVPRIGSLPAAATAAAGWTAAVALTRGSDVLFSPAGQSVLALLLAAGLAVLLLLRADFDLDKGIRA